MESAKCGCGSNFCGEEDLAGEGDGASPDVELASEGVAEFVRCVAAIDPLDGRGRGLNAFESLRDAQRVVESGMLAAMIDVSKPDSAGPIVEQVYIPCFQSLLIGATGLAMAAGFDPAAASLAILSRIEEIAAAHAAREAESKPAA